MWRFMPLASSRASCAEKGREGGLAEGKGGSCVCVCDCCGEGLVGGNGGGVDGTRKSRKLVFSIAAADPPESSPLPSVHPRKQMSEPGRCTVPSLTHTHTRTHTQRTQHNTGQESNGWCLRVVRDTPAVRESYKKNAAGGLRGGRGKECEGRGRSRPSIYSILSLNPPLDGAVFCVKCDDLQPGH